MAAQANLSRVCSKSAIVAITESSTTMSPTISPEVEQPSMAAPLKWSRSSPTGAPACISDLAPKMNTTLCRPISPVGKFGRHPSL
jgi:hypothetical protein